MEILETKGRKMNKIKREEREDLHTFLDTTFTDICPDFKSIDSYVKLEFRLIEDTPLYKKADTPHGISAILL